MYVHVGPVLLNEGPHLISSEAIGRQGLEDEDRVCGWSLKVATKNFLTVNPTDGRLANKQASEFDAQLVEWSIPTLESTNHHFERLRMRQPDGCAPQSQHHWPIGKVAAIQMTNLPDAVI